MCIYIKGARVHNLKNIEVEIPHNRLVVITGLSGSGKSTLAFDTIFAEGQRRYVESLSAYARQFLGKINKPDVDVITGIAPAIAIEQKVNTRNPRSTVGSRTVRSAPRPNCTTTLNCSTPASDTPSRPYRDRRSSATPRTTWRNISSPCPKAAAWPSQRRCNCAKGRASSKN